MNPLYVVIALVVGLAAYLLFTGRRRPIDKTPVLREAPRRKVSSAKSARQSRKAAEADDKDEIKRESAPPPAATTKHGAKPAPKKSPSSADLTAKPDDEEHEEAGADEPPCPCGSSKPFSRCHGVEAPDGPVQEAAQPAEESRPLQPKEPRSRPSPRGENRSSFKYFGKTVLLYEPSHGNQIEYYDTNGKSYLWYPGNGGILAGEWRLEGDTIYSRYGIPTHNPVTGQRDIAGAWSSCPVVQMLTTEVDVAAGDVLDLASGRLPYRLPAHPGFRSLQEAKLERRYR